MLEPACRGGINTVAKKRYQAVGFPYKAIGAGREGQTSPVRSCEDRVVSVVHRGFGGVWVARAEHPGRVGQSSHGGAKKGHFPFGQRLPGDEIAGGAGYEGDH